MENTQISHQILSYLYIKCLAPLFYFCLRIRPSIHYLLTEIVQMSQTFKYDTDEPFPEIDDIIEPFTF